VQQIVNAAAHLLRRIGFLEQLHAWSKRKSRLKHIGAVPAAEQNGNAGTQGGNAFVRLAPSHVWHDRIEHEQRDVLGVAFEEINRLNAVGSREHTIAVPFENLRRQMPNGAFILDQQDGLVPATRNIGRRRSLRTSIRPSCCWMIP
jgi:hypothetical protein